MVYINILSIRKFLKNKHLKKKIILKMYIIDIGNYLLMYIIDIGKVIRE